MTEVRTISEVARVKKLTRQAIYSAIKQNRLKATKDSGAWKITDKQMDEYEDHKYNRAYSYHEGVKIYDEARGRISVDRAAEICNSNKQKIYYAIRTGQIKFRRLGASYVLDLKSTMEYAQKNKGKQRIQLKLG